VLREDVTAEMLKTVLHRPPRDFGFQTRMFPLELLVKQCVRLGWMARPVSRCGYAPNAGPLRDQLEAVQALDHQSRSIVPAKKSARDRLVSWASQESQAALWAIGFLAEVWWSRFALQSPFLMVWERLHQRCSGIQKAWAKLCLC
jgi:hypothetical protein